MSSLKWFVRAPAQVPAQVPPPGMQAGDALPEVFTPPEVIHGGGEADWALWDECVAAWDRSATAAAAAGAAAAKPAAA